MIGFRHNDSRFPFLWEDDQQPPARWHRTGEGPVQYLSDTPTGAWAEFLRHEEITDEADLKGINRAMWAVRIAAADFSSPQLAAGTLRGGNSSYPACQQEAARLRSEGATAIRSCSAALLDGAARGWRVENGYQPGPDADGQVFILFGSRPHTVGWCVVSQGRPPSGLLALVRPL